MSNTETTNSSSRHGSARAQPLDAAWLNSRLKANKPVASAMAASLISTFAGYPLDSLKSRLQASRAQTTVFRMAAQVFREEGIQGFYRGLWIPLFTISFVRAASFTIYNGTKSFLYDSDYTTPIFSRRTLGGIASTSALGGATAGALICFGSAPFELVKIRRQLEFSIAEARGQRVFKPPGTIQAVVDIMRQSGFVGLYYGFKLHFVRDTLGTALYFAEYDSLRHVLGRQPSGEQGKLPGWFPVHPSVVPFLCGSFAGVSSWALIYPLDAIKTKVQQRALAGGPKRGLWETLNRMVRGTDQQHPKPFLVGMGRLYRGLGVSAVRSVITHGMLWTFLDYISLAIDRLPTPTPLPPFLPR